jgi:hypothetical protein
MATLWLITVGEKVGAGYRRGGAPRINEDRNVVEQSPAAHLGSCEILKQVACSIANLLSEENGLQSLLGLRREM